MLLHSEVEQKSHPHPERPDRLRAIAANFAVGGIFPGKCFPISAREASLEELGLIHSTEHVNAVKATSYMLSSYFTSDTYANEHSARAARLAAGLCADLASAIMQGQARNGFALVRPPGHHAGVKQPMGFCLHNNAAVAALAARAAGADRVLIVDWIGCSLIGSIGALYNGVLLINLAVSLFALVAIESSSQSLGLTYAVLLVCAIVLHIAWFVLFFREIWNISTDKYGGFVIFSLRVALWMEIFGFSVRLLSSFVWFQMYRLGPAGQNSKRKEEKKLFGEPHFILVCRSKYQKNIEASHNKGGNVKPIVPNCIRSENYIITFESEEEKFPLFGKKYQLKFTGDISSETHCLVHFPSLIRLAREAGLEYVEIQNLTEFYDDNRAQFAGLLCNGGNFVDPRGKLLGRSFDLLGLYTTFIFRKPDLDLVPPICTPVSQDASHMQMESSDHGVGLFFELRNPTQVHHGSRLPQCRDDGGSAYPPKEGGRQTSGWRHQSTIEEEKYGPGEAVVVTNGGVSDPPEPIVASKITKGILGAGPADLRFAEPL